MRVKSLKPAILVVCMAVLLLSGSVMAADKLPESAQVPKIDLWITSQTYDPVRYEIGMMLAQQWRKLGFEVDITSMEWATMSSKGMKGHEHDAFMIQWGGKPERIDPLHWLYTLHHSSEAKAGGYNVAGYESPKYDEIVDKFITSTDLEERKKAAFQAQAILARDVPQPPLIHRVITHAYNARDFENPVVAMGEGMNSFWNWLSLTPRGDRLDARFGYVNDVKLLNPLSTKTGADIYILKMIYDPLVRIDAEGKPVPWAAESYRYLDDTTLEVKLKDGMTFHDGRPVSVEDVKYTFDLAKEVKSPYYYSKIKKLDRVEIVDDHTLKFFLATPYGPFITNGLGTVGILPKHIWEARFKENGADGVLRDPNLPPIGSGPFKFEYWRPNEELKLSRFQNHFHPPKIASFIRIPYAKAYGVVQGLQAGEVDAAGWSLLPIEQQALAKADHLKIEQVDDQGSYILHYNLRKAPFDDVNVRRALTSAIPKKMIVELIFESMAVPAYSVVAPVNAYWSNPDVEKLGDDMNKARQILEEAGFRWNKKGRIYFPADYKVKKRMD